jgi:hypothetical protein
VAALPEQNGQPIFRPGPASTLAVAGLLAFAGLLVLAHAPVAAVVLLARSIGDVRYIGFFKRVRDTRFAKLDTRIYSPIALLLGIATAVVAWGMP